MCSTIDSIVEIVRLVKLIEVLYEYMMQFAGLIFPGKVPLV